MGIGVEQSIDENLFQIGPEEFIGKRGAIDLYQFEGTQRGYLFAWNILHREDSTGSEILNWFWNNQIFKLRKVLPKSNEVVCLAGEIEFTQQAFPELHQHVLKFVTLTQLSMRIEEACDLIQRIKIFHNRFSNIRALY